MTETSRTSAELAGIEQAVREVIAGELQLATSDVDMSRDLRNVEGVDSVKVLRVIAKVERKYDIELADEQVFSFKSGNDVVAAVAEVISGSSV